MFVQSFHSVSRHHYVISALLIHCTDTARMAGKQPNFPSELTTSDKNLHFRYDSAVLCALPYADNPVRFDRYVLKSHVIKAEIHKYSACSFVLEEAWLWTAICREGGIECFQF